MAFVRWATVNFSSSNEIEQPLHGTNQTGLVKTASSDDAAKESIAKDYQEATSDEDKKRTATLHFLGVYLNSTRGIESYCRSVNVDTSAFSMAYKNIHVYEYSIAKKHINNSPYKTVDNLYKTLKNTSDKAVKRNMETIANMYSIGASDVCIFFATKAVEDISTFHISETDPLIYKNMK